MKRRIIYIVFSTLIILIIGSICLAKYVLPYAIIQPPRVSENITPSELNLQSKSLDIITKDSLNLKGYWIKSDSISPKSVIICVHGIGGCKEHFLQLSKNLSKIGVETILVDGRAHGKSEGLYCTYGFKEKQDIKKIVNLIKEVNDSIPIGIWGNSMGGAIALQAMELDKRINFGIIESTFTNLKDIVYDYQKSHTFGIGLKPLCNIALNEAGKLAQFNPKLVAPIKSVKNITQPVIIAHGEMDENIKFEYGKLLYHNLASIDKKFIPVKNAGHFNLAEKGGRGYSEAIESFILKYSHY